MATRREIVGALMRKEIPERMGVHEHFWPYICENAWAVQGVLPGADFTRRFDLDLASANWYDPPSPRPDLKAVLEETDVWVVEREAWGNIVKKWKTRAGTPEHVGFTLTGPDVWYREFRDAFRAMDPCTGVDLARIRTEMARLRSEDRFVTLSFMGVFEWQRRVLGDVAMLEAILLEKKFLHDFNRAFVDTFIAFYRRVFRDCGLPDGIHLYEDVGYTQAPFCSPACHRELVLPYHRELFGFFKDHRLPIIVHTCGEFRPHLPALVEAGADCIQALEAKTGMNVVDLAREWKDRLCFMGNLDVRAFESGDRARIRAEVLGKLEGMRRLRAPYVAMSDHSIPPSVAVADFEFYLDLVRNHGRY